MVSYLKAFILTTTPPPGALAHIRWGTNWFREQGGHISQRVQRDLNFWQDRVKIEIDGP